MYKELDHNMLNDANIHLDISNMFEKIVKTYPAVLAAKYKDEEITYDVLNKKANRMARFLREKGIAKDQIVAIYGERSIKFLEGILATFKAGGAYMPINPSFPEKRVIQMVEQSRVKVVLVDEALKNTFLEIADKVKQDLTVFTIEEVELQDYSEENLGLVVEYTDLAYLIFTSGSTGMPKGVMLQRGGMINHLFSKINDMKISDEDIVAQTASQCFDISVWQFLSALLVGGCVHIFENDIVNSPEQLLDKVEVENISVMQLVPSMLRTILNFLDGQKNKKYTLSSLRC